jgi:hypothetical protein
LRRRRHPAITAAGRSTRLLAGDVVVEAEHQQSVDVVQNPFVERQTEARLVRRTGKPALGAR